MRLSKYFGLVLLCFSSLSIGGPINGLVNTGAGFSAGQQDNNYQLTTLNDIGGDFGFVSSNSNWPIRGPWLNNTTSSSWLTPTNNAAQSLDPFDNGIYTWSLSFDLSGLDASTASFSGRWAADNLGIARLNGQEISSINGFRNWSSFDSSGASFFAGLNTLEFEVTNLAQTRGNPTGVRVEFLSSNIDTVAVSEPSTLALFGIGLAGLFAARRR